MMTMTTTQTACAMRTVMTTKSKAVRRASVARRAGEQDGQMNQQMEGGCVALRFVSRGARGARRGRRARCAVRGMIVLCRYRSRARRLEGILATCSWKILPMRG